MGQSSTLAAAPTAKAYSIDLRLPITTKSLLCPVCLKSKFSTTSQLKTHARRVHQLHDILTPSTCSKCERHFTSFQCASHHYRRCLPKAKSTTNESQPPPDVETFPTTPVPVPMRPPRPTPTTTADGYESPPTTPSNPTAPEVMTTDDHPTDPEYHPRSIDAPVTAPDHLPTSPDVSPTGPDHRPTTSEVVPTTSEVVPTLSDHLPTTSDVSPTVPDHLPTISDAMPMDPDDTPTPSDTIPPPAHPYLTPCVVLPTSPDTHQTDYVQPCPDIVFVPDTQCAPCLIFPSQDIQINRTPDRSQEQPNLEDILSQNTSSNLRTLDANEVDPMETFLEDLEDPDELSTNPDDTILSPTVPANLRALDVNEVDPMETFLSALDSQPATKRRATDSIESLEASLRNAASAYLPPTPPTRDSTSSPTPSSEHLTADHDDRRLDAAPPSPRRRRPLASDFFNLYPPHATQRNNLPQSNPPTTEERPEQGMDTAETADPAQPEIDLNAPADRSRNQALLEEFRTHWNGRFNADLSWEDFSEACAEFAERGQELGQIVSRSNPHRPQPRRPDRPSARPAARPPHGQFRQRFDRVEAQKIQLLYRHSKKRAARKVLQPDSPFYTGSIQNADAFYRQMFARKPCDIDGLKRSLIDHVPTGPTDESLFQAPTADEIRAKIRSNANTSPGPDRIEYRHLKSIDPSCEILALIYQHCMAQRDVPASWKCATTVMIHKKGSTEDPTNFRPIALMSCVYKVLMGVLAKRLTRWSIDNDILSPQQKSARPAEGCYEHSFLLQSLVGDARRNQKNVFLAWLDLRNAFGSIPHAALTTTLTHMGAPQEFVSMVSNLYTDSYTQIRVGQDYTEHIPLLAGVKQGCPLSPILFNLSIELILRQAKKSATEIGPALHHETPLSILAYADDLVVISRHRVRLQKILDAVSTAANTLGLTFRPDKSASLSFTNSKRAPNKFELFEYEIQNQPMPILEEEENYRYLGVPIGVIHNYHNVESLVQPLIDDLNKVEASLLAPWQKLDLIRTFLQPSLTFALRAGFTQKQTLTDLRKQLVATVKSICNLPNRATTHYIFAHKKTGGLGLQDPTAEVDVQAVVHAVKLLSSNDPTVAHIARAELLQTVRHASQANPTAALVSNYLSSAEDRRLENIRYRVSSVWTRARNATRRLGLKINFSATEAPTIEDENVLPVPAVQACRFLHAHVQLSHSAELTALPDQGKVARTLQNDQYANGSTWQFTGLNLRFRDWRFVHRARLNCIPLNSPKSRWSNCSPTCRHCNDDETLPHVICHCLPNMVAIRQRHDKICDRLTNAIRFGEVTTDRCVPDTSRLRPDIVLEELNQVSIIDVTCPFENDPQALDDAAQRKVNKYASLVEHFLGIGKQATVLPFVIGALGTWYPPNEIVLRRLGMTKRYKKLFRKLCCTDVIQGSSDIYRLHLGIDVMDDLRATAED